MTSARGWIAGVWLVAAASPPACKEAAPPVAEEKRDERGGLTGAARAALRALPAEDGMGYLSGNYHTGHNNPITWVDDARQRFVFMGRQYRIEVPLDQPDRAFEMAERLLLDHGYPASGKDPAETRPTLEVDGQKMVVVQMAELFPEMPEELKKRFTDQQRDVLYKTAGGDGVRLFSGHDGDYPPHPAMWAASDQVVVAGPGTWKDFPVQKLAEAFAEYRALIGRTGVARGGVAP